MSKISPKPPSAYPWYLKLFFLFQKKKYGSPLEPTLLWGRIPRIFLGFVFMQKAFNRKKSNLSPLLRALVTVRVSQLNQCEFCIDMNSFFLLQRGATKDKLLDISLFRQSSLFTDSEKIALEYTEAITQLNKSSDELFDKLKQHFKEDSIVELTALIAFQNLSSKFNAALDAKEFGFCKKTAK